MMLPHDYLRAVADAVHNVGGIFVLDCIASGTIWVDMEATGVDVLCSAPQKGWSGPPCAGLVMLSPRGSELLAETQSSSFSCDLRKWRDIMAAARGVVSVAADDFGAPGVVVCFTADADVENGAKFAAAGIQIPFCNVPGTLQNGMW